MAGGESQDSVDELTPIYRAVQEHIASLRKAEAGAEAAMARRIGEVLGLTADEVIAAIRKNEVIRAIRNRYLWLGTPVGEDEIIIGSSRLVLPKLEIIGIASATASAGDVSVEVHQGDIGELSARATRDGIGTLSTVQVLALVLVWLMALGLPVVQARLPQADRALLDSEYGTIGIGLAITAMILARKK
jgi:hypothetical protein